MEQTPRDESSRLVSDLAAGRPEGETLIDTLADVVGEALPTELYLRILTDGPVPTSDLLGHHADPALRTALTVLETRGLVVEENNGWRVTPPERALPTLAGQLEARATSIRAALPGLIAAHRNAIRQEPRPTIAGTERLSGEGEVAFAFAQCFSNARHEAKAMRVGSMTTRRSTFAALPGAEEGRLGVSGRPVTVSTVIDTSLFTDFTGADFAAFQQAPNVHVTLATGVPFTAAVNDQGVAVVETFLEGRIDGLLLRDPGLVASIEATIDLMLRLAVPLRLGPSGVDVISDEERTILGLLAAGVPDATISRRVGISQRTLDRRIRGLMDRLNATTRFQAGVQAGARGWL